MSTVYILGAGASACFDRSGSGIKCPSAKNFFTVADRLLKSEPREETENYSSLVFFLKKYFNLTMDGIETAGLDMQDVLTFLDLELEYSDSRDEIEFLQLAREQFMDLLSVTFSKALAGPPCPYHGSLASYLAEGDTVISFNYDLLMDTALTISCPYWNPLTGYGFRAGTAGQVVAGNEVSAPKVLLLKPHGSFNWVICKKCGSFFVLPPSQCGVPLKSACLNDLWSGQPRHDPERLIIPPSLKKDVHGKIMQQVWTRAHNALENAGRVVVIGYSLPAADFLVKRLLYRSLSRNRALDEFELVDRNNHRSGSPLINKYRAIIRNCGNDVKFICDKKNIREFTACLDWNPKKTEI